MGFILDRTVRIVVLGDEGVGKTRYEQPARSPLPFLGGRFRQEGYIWYVDRFILLLSRKSGGRHPFPGVASPGRGLMLRLHLRCNLAPFTN
jgi:hypothetical protein